MKILFIIFGCCIAVPQYLAAQKLPKEQAIQQIKALNETLDVSFDYDHGLTISHKILSMARENELIEEELHAVYNIIILQDNYDHLDSLQKWLAIQEGLMKKYVHNIREELMTKLEFHHHYYIAKYYHKLGNFNQAEKAYLWLWNTWKDGNYQKSASDELVEVYFFTNVSLRWCASLFRVQGKYLEAIDAYKRCLRLEEFEYGDSQINTDQRALIYTDIASSFAQDGQIDESIKYWNLAWNTQLGNMSRTPDIGYAPKSMNGWAHYILTRRILSSIEFNYQVDSIAYFLQIAEQLDLPYDEVEARWKILVAKARYSSLLGNSPKAIDYFHQALAILYSTKSITKVDFAELQWQLSQEWQAINLDSALYWVNQTLVTIAPRFHPNDEAGLHLPESNQVYFKKYLINAAGLKTRIFLAKAKNNQQNSTQYLSYAQQCGAYQMQLMDDIRGAMAFEGDRGNLIAHAYHSLESFWEVYLLQYQQTGNKQILHDLYAMEAKAKGRLILDALADRSALDNGTIPDYEVAELDSLSSNIAHIEKIIHRLQDGDPDLPHQYLQLALATQAYNEFNEDLKSKYLKPSNIPSIPVTVPLVQQKLLANEGALLEYFTGDKSIILFIITSNDLHVLQIPKPIELEQNIGLLITSMNKSQPKIGRAYFKDFANPSEYLYELLVKEALSHLKKSDSKLIIVPDGILFQVPFELLGVRHQQIDSPKEFEYLLKSYAVSYTNSTQLLLQQKEMAQMKPVTHTETFGGYAPKYTENGNISTERGGFDSGDLPFARKEVAEVANMLHGKAYLSEEATLAQFLKSANKYRILLLSMHTNVDLRKPNFTRLHFSHMAGEVEDKSQLMIIDVQRMKLAPQMVVLSACQSAVGSLHKGEGMYGLARGFMIAGAESVVMSLWSVPDETTYPLMTSFFKHIKAGKPKDEAMRAAKLEYLDNDSNHEKINPCYWGGFVVSGLTKPLKIE